jgi:type VI protein secretion system component VasK
MKFRIIITVIVTLAVGIIIYFTSPHFGFLKTKQDIEQASWFLTVAGSVLTLMICWLFIIVPYQMKKHREKDEFLEDKARYLKVTGSVIEQQIKDHKAKVKERLNRK